MNEPDEFEEDKTSDTVRTIIVIAVIGFVFTLAIQFFGGG